MMNTRFWIYPVASALFMCAAAVPISQPPLAQETNACPVDGCLVTIQSVEPEGDELKVVFEANFAPAMSRNHLHVWWGEAFDVRQVSNNAETVHGVTQGSWHPTDDYPNYVTQSAASTGERGEAVSLCVSAADRNHDILDPELLHCVSVEEHLQ